MPAPAVACLAPPLYRSASFPGGFPELVAESSYEHIVGEGRRILGA